MWCRLEAQLNCAALDCVSSLKTMAATVLEKIPISYFLWNKNWGKGWAKPKMGGGILVPP